MKKRTVFVGLWSVHVLVAAVALAVFFSGGAFHTGAQGKSGDAIELVLREATEQKKLPGIAALVANADAVI
jgi:hypothetical protein